MYSAIARLGDRVLGRDRQLSLLDQALAAATRFAALVFFARVLTQRDFGVAALAVSVGFIFIGFANAAIAMPFVALCGTPERLERDGGSWLVLGMSFTALSLILPALGYLLCLAVQAPDWTTEVALYSIVMSPASVMYELSRRWLFQNGRFRSVLLQAGTFVALSAIAIAVFAKLEPTIPFGIGGLGAAYLLAVVIGLAGNVPRVHATFVKVLDTWRRAFSYARWTIGEFLADSLQYYGMNLLVAGLAGPVDAAVFIATRNLIAPIATLQNAVGYSELARMSRAYSTSGHRGLATARSSAIRFGLVIGGPYLLLVALFAGPLLSVVYGTQYVPHAVTLRLWALATCLTPVVSPLALWLIASLATRALFMRKLVGGLVTLAAALLLLPKLPVDGAVIAIAIGAATNAVLLALTRPGTHMP